VVFFVAVKNNTPERKPPYRLDRLPVIMPYHRRSNNRLKEGDLVYYGPCPEFYGIGEILSMVDDFCLVDFRGTGKFPVHKDVYQAKYLIPIHKLNLTHLVTER
jgi:hypothetical protein